MNIKHYIGSKVHTPGGLALITSCNIQTEMCTVVLDSSDTEMKFHESDLTLILRPLTDASEEEIEQMGFRYIIDQDNLEQEEIFDLLYTPYRLDYARSHHFDVEGLIQQGKVIDATQMETNPYSTKAANESLTDVAGERCPSCKSDDLIDIDDHYTKCKKCGFQFLG